MVEIMYLINLYSSMYNINPELTKAVIAEESSFNAKAMGKLGEIGLMQIRPEYTNIDKARLYIPRVNIKCGVGMLAKARKICEPKLGKTWPICYNLGASRGLKVKYPEQYIYYKKLTKYMRSK